MAVVWNNDKVLKLIDLFQNQQVLWDSNHKFYKDKFTKEEAWRSICTDIGIEKEEVRCKLHSLRSQFARERRKMRAGEGEEEGIRWVFYERMKFLLNGSCSSNSDRKRTLNITVEENSEDTRNPIASPTPSPPPPKLYKKRKQKPQPISSLHLDDETEEEPPIRTTNTNLYQGKDEHDIYGQYIASEMRNTEDVHSVLQAKYLINKIILNMRMGKLDNTRRSYYFNKDQDLNITVTPLQEFTIVKKEYDPNIDSD